MFTLNAAWPVVALPSFSLGVCLYISSLHLQQPFQSMQDNMLFEYESLLRSYKSRCSRKQTMRPNRQYFCLQNPRLCQGFISSLETWMFSRMRQKKTTLSTRESGCVFLELHKLSRVYHSLCLETGAEND